MTQAQKTFELAHRMRLLARAADRLDYAEKMARAADDLEDQAARLERLGDATTAAIRILARAS
jgi:hypothetical protein